MSGHFLLLLGFAVGAGVITAISPCVYPVLPIVLAGGSSRRPLRIIAGLVASFATFTLFATWILKQLGLPQDFLRNLAIALLFVLAATLVFPQVARWLERPFYSLTRRQPRGKGFLLGVSLGLVFVPCGGPVIGAVSANAARVDFGWRTILVTVFYALGAAVPMLAVAYLGEGVTRRMRASAPRLRPVLGIVMALAALAIIFNADQKLQTWFPNYTDALQGKVERNSVARKELAKLHERHGRGPNAPAFKGIDDWINSKPLTIQGLRGKVVLVDFWTYSCINCLRTLPHLEAWYRAYHGQGLEIVGVHTPEFQFEHSLANVSAATKRLGVRYPVALDNEYETWNAYSNQYWPAEYLIDRRGHVRHYHFGEGEYGRTEQLIRRLLAPERARLPTATAIADRTPMAATTPESYLGYRRLDRYAGSDITRDRFATYRFPASLPLDELAYGGSWLVGGERIVAGRDARLRLHFHAHDVYLVLGGSGTVRVLLDGRAARTVRVTGDRLYTLVSGKKLREALLELRFSPGVQAYAFTFG